SGGGRVAQLRCNFVRLLELCARLLLFSFLMEGQCKIVVRFRIARLEAHSLDKLRLRHADVPRLQQHQAEIVVSFREIRIAAYEFTEDIGCASGIVLLAEDQSQLYTGVIVLGIQIDGFIQLSSAFLWTPRLRQREAQVVM